MCEGAGLCGWAFGCGHVKLWSVKEGSYQSKAGKFGMKDPAPKVRLRRDAALHDACCPE
jgi:hypothetical protein